MAVDEVVEIGRRLLDPASTRLGLTAGAVLLLPGLLLLSQRTLHPPAARWTYAILALFGLLAAIDGLWNRFAPRPAVTASLVGPPLLVGGLAQVLTEPWAAWVDLPLVLGMIALTLAGGVLIASVHRAALFAAGIQMMTLAGVLIVAGEVLYAGMASGAGDVPATVGALLTAVGAFMMTRTMRATDQPNLRA